MVTAWHLAKSVDVAAGPAWIRPNTINPRARKHVGERLWLGRPEGRRTLVEIIACFAGRQGRFANGSVSLFHKFHNSYFICEGL